MTTWIVIVAVGLGSYALRAAPLLFDGRWLRSPRFERTVGHAGTAALAALVATGLSTAATGPAEIAAVLAAATLALVVAVRGWSMLRILLCGGLAYAGMLASISLLA